MLGTFLLWGYARRGSRPRPRRDYFSGGSFTAEPRIRLPIPGRDRHPPNPAISMHFDKPTYSVRRTKKKDIPEGLYTKDSVTGEILFNKEIEDNQMVVPKSGHHF